MREGRGRMNAMRISSILLSISLLPSVALAAPFMPERDENVSNGADVVALQEVTQSRKYVQSKGSISTKVSSAARREARIAARKKRLKNLSSCSHARTFGVLDFCLLDGWKQQDKDFIYGIPFVGFYSYSSVEGVPLLIVVSELKLPRYLRPISFGAFITDQLKGMTDYELIETRPLTFNGQKNVLYIFNARFDAEKPLYRFYVIGVMNGKKGYVVSGAIPPDFSAADEQSVLSFFEGMKFRTLR